MKLILVSLYIIYSFIIYVSFLYYLTNQIIIEIKKRLQLLNYLAFLDLTTIIKKITLKSN